MSVTDREMPLTVMAGLVPAIHAVGQARTVEGDPARLRGGARGKSFPLLQLNHVDGRDKPGHDGIGCVSAQ